jgi:hypothetical protein
VAERLPARQHDSPDRGGERLPRGSQSGGGGGRLPRGSRSASGGRRRLPRGSRVCRISGGERSCHGGSHSRNHVSDASHAQPLARPGPGARAPPDLLSERLPTRLGNPPRGGGCSSLPPRGHISRIRGTSDHHTIATHTVRKPPRLRPHCHRQRNLHTTAATSSVLWLRAALAPTRRRRPATTPLLEHLLHRGDRLGLTSILLRQGHARRQDAARRSAWNHARLGGKSPRSDRWHANIRRPQRRQCPRACAPPDQRGPGK